MPVYSILIVSFWWIWGVFLQADNFFSLIFIEIWNLRCGIWVNYCLLSILQSQVYSVNFSVTYVVGEFRKLVENR